MIRPWPLATTLIKTVTHFFPGLWKQLQALPDKRQQSKVDYPGPMLLLIVILGLLLKTGSMRGFRGMATDPCVRNLQVMSRRLFGCEFPDRFPDETTLADYLVGQDPEAIGEVRCGLVRELVRGRVLEGFRLLGRFYLVAIDGTGCLVFANKHCDHCLTKKHKSGAITYYHPVLEAKLITRNGMSISIGTEFIENEAPDVSKQDCELKAFYRLAAKLKKDFPQLPICLLLDGLFANSPVMAICENADWSYLITFKAGSLPTLYDEYRRTRELAAQSKTVGTSRGSRFHQWTNGLEHDAHALNVLECNEVTSPYSRTFMYITNIEVTEENIQELTQGGRDRWKIENEGFNTQKNGGWELEHAYSKSLVGAKVVYLLIQIAHLFEQLLVRGSLHEWMRKARISVKVFSRRLFAVLTETTINEDEFGQTMLSKIQIRLDTG